MKATDLTTNRILAGDLAVAETFFTRLKGLLGKTSLTETEGLWIKPCKGVHTFGMRFPIDVVFLNRDNRVVEIIRALQPNQMTRLYQDASSVIELPAGTLDSSETVIGNEVEIV